MSAHICHQEQQVPCHQRIVWLDTPHPFSANTQLLWLPRLVFCWKGIARTISGIRTWRWSVAEKRTNQMCFFERLRMRRRWHVMAAERHNGNSLASVANAFDGLLATSDKGLWSLSKTFALWMRKRSGGAQKLSGALKVVSWSQWQTGDPPHLYKDLSFLSSQRICDGLSRVRNTIHSWLKTVRAETLPYRTSSLKILASHSDEHRLTKENAWRELVQNVLRHPNLSPRSSMVLILSEGFCRFKPLGLVSFKE